MITQDGSVSTSSISAVSTDGLCLICSRVSFGQIIEASKAPVVASHVGLRAICNNPANMPDDILRALAAKGGLEVRSVGAGPFLADNFALLLNGHPVVALPL